MKKNELKKIVISLYRNAIFKDMFFENVSSEDIIRENKLENVNASQLKEAIACVRKQLEK